ncbi:SWI/SNF complex protein [Gymnopus androsaceus JB14]|uniref:SWI/SNF complex protein n=1 Tax=Gymnopus androsaceus JB14 TaxID=1447944 RepID=A0A6A4HN14_9AGAR|nr:SWI/SNF complex protein [Gymnopus androsaceus JB14]
MDGHKAAKRRKLTDKSLPNVILQNPDFAEDSQMYQSLLDMERKLDWTMARKRIEIQDTMSRTPTATRTLRLFVSHTVSGQSWQTGTEGRKYGLIQRQARAFQLGSSKLRQTVRGKDKGPPRKFSTFIKRMMVEFDRDTNLYPENNIWPRATGHQNPPLDGFTIRRTGDAPTSVRIVMYLDHYPEQYRLSPDLSNVLGIKEESRLGAVQAVWNYIKIQGLQDKGDKRLIRADDRLRGIFGMDTIPFQKLPELVTRHLAPPEPILLHYSFDPSVPPPEQERPSAWDVEIKLEDAVLKTRMGAMVHTNKETAQALSKMDEEIAILAQSLHNSHLKRTFLQSFANDPAQFIQTWIDSQSRDLESVLGAGQSEGLTLRQEELRRSEFFRLPWVEEAVSIQEGLRLASK